MKHAQSIRLPVTALARRNFGGHTELPWEPSFFVKPDGSPVETIDDVNAIMLASAAISGKPVLWGVSATEPDGSVVICYTGNGPKSEAHAKMIANVCSNWPAALKRIAELEKKLAAVTRHRDEMLGALT